MLGRVFLEALWWVSVVPDRRPSAVTWEPVTQGKPAHRRVLLLGEKNTRHSARPPRRIGRQMTGDATWGQPIVGRASLPQMNRFITPPRLDPALRAIRANVRRSVISRKAGETGWMVRSETELDSRSVLGWTAANGKLETKRPRHRLSPTPRC